MAEEIQVTLTPLHRVTLESMAEFAKAHMLLNNLDAEAYTINLLMSNEADTLVTVLTATRTGFPTLRFEHTNVNNFCSMRVSENEATAEVK